MELDVHMKPCPGCKYPIDREAIECPRCGWNRRKARDFSVEFWGSLIVFTIIFAIGAGVAALAAHLFQQYQ